jgi:peptidoglycan/LPS O-acetylase OafA/YrhL
MGLTGKLAVALFCVMLGYFAASKFSSDGVCYEKYVAYRYLQFVAPLFIVNVIVSVNTFNGFNIIVIRQIISDSFFFSYKIVPTFWCMGPFFVASLLIALIAHLTREDQNKQIAWFITALIVSLLIGETWVGICVMGAILYNVIYRDYQWMKNGFALIGLVVCTYFLVRSPESELTYIRDGVACSLMLIVAFNMPMIQKSLDIKITKWLGLTSFFLYLVHVPVQVILTPSIIRFFARNVPANTVLMGSYIVTFTADVLLAFILYKMVDQITKVFLKISAIPEKAKA